jgi:Zn-dependent peptidase ImmA (M78 family)
MKLRIGKNGISVGTFRLTSTDIEQQMISDLLRYRGLFLSRYGSAAATPLDVESFIKELWGIEVDYDEFQQNDDEDLLGLFEPEKQRIVIDPKACNNKGRISFTVAHEAGHLSLHSFLFVFNNGKVSGWQNKQSPVGKNLERQADLYAASLLAPKQEIYDFLKEKGLSDGSFLASPIDLAVYAPAFQDRFGLSRQALEIRLSRLNLSMTNRKYLD